MIANENVMENLRRLEEIKKKEPHATHVYMRRTNKDNLAVDIPISHADFTIRNNPIWILEESNKQMDYEIEQLFLEPEVKIESPIVEVPPRPSEIKKRRGRPPKVTNNETA